MSDLLIGIKKRKDIIFYISNNKLDNYIKTILLITNINKQ